MKGNLKAMQDERHAFLLRELAADRGDDFRESYSGRGMYGASCVGIVTSDPDGVIEDAALLGIRHAKRDGMGRRTIVYWPHITARAAAVSAPLNEDDFGPRAQDYST